MENGLKTTTSHQDPLVQRNGTEVRHVKSGAEPLGQLRAVRQRRAHAHDLSSYRENLSNQVHARRIQSTPATRGDNLEHHAVFGPCGCFLDTRACIKAPYTDPIPRILTVSAFTMLKCVSSTETTSACTLDKPPHHHKAQPHTVVTHLRALPAQRGLVPTDADAHGATRLGHRCPFSSGPVSSEDLSLIVE